MNTRIDARSIPAGAIPPSPVSASPVNPSPVVANPAPTASPPASSTLAPTDQNEMTQHADYAFSPEGVTFPETAEKNPPTYAGLGEIMGTIAALFSGAPSDSFSPVIAQAEKNLAERRQPQKPEAVEVDTAASDKSLQD